MKAYQVKPAGAGAVMASRREPPDSLDFFPTPPWATRALCEHVLKPRGHGGGGRGLGVVWDPACGEGHMAVPLAEYCSLVYASDIFDYETAGQCGGRDVLDFLSADARMHNTGVDWIVTNPPFNAAVDFALQALELAAAGVALLCRNQWIEGAGRYARLFRDRPPAVIAPFVERVPMVKGRWDPDASTATAYSWFVWETGRPVFGPPTAVSWIPPGCRQSLTRPEDFSRFAAAKPDVSGLPFPRPDAGTSASAAPLLDRPAVTGARGWPARLYPRFDGVIVLCLRYLPRGRYVVWGTQGRCEIRRLCEALPDWAVTVKLGAADHAALMAAIRADAEAAVQARAAGEARAG